MEVIKNFDTFGKEFKFNIEGGKLKTFLGGLINILLMLGTLVCIWYFGKDLYEKKSPVFLSEEVILQKAPFINIEHFENEIIFAIKIETEDGDIAHEDGFYFPIFFVYDEIKDTENEIEKEQCDSDRFNNDPRMDEDKYYCYSYNKTFGERLFNINPEILYDDETDNKNRGSYVDNGLILKFELRKCSIVYEQKYNITCPTPSEYIKYDKNVPRFIMSYFISSNLINPKDYTKPYRSFFKFYEDIANKKKAYFRNPSYLVSQVKSDVGFLFETFENKFFLEFNELLKLDSDSEFMEGFNFYFEFNLSPRFKIYRRIYIKIQDLIAQVGGFMSLITFVTQFLYSFYSDSCLKIILIIKLNYALNIQNYKK